MNPLDMLDKLVNLLLAGAAMLVSKEAAVDQLYAAIRTVLAAR